MGLKLGRQNLVNGCVSPGRTLLMTSLCLATFSLCVTTDAAPAVSSHSSIILPITSLAIANESYAELAALQKASAEPAPAPATQAPEDNIEWYRHATGYHIWLKSFADGDGDQIGDFKGIIQRFDYLNDGNPASYADLGVDLILLSPFYQSARQSNDPLDNIHGYDVTDYYQINPLFGDEEDLKALLALAKSRGVKVLFDFVPGYTSVEHPWFKSSRAGGKYKSWYPWRDEAPTDWEDAWGGGEWHHVWKPADGRYFYTYFQSEEIADLDHHNPLVREEMAKVLRYWLDFGFDGARVDGTPYLIEDGPTLQADRPATFELLKQYRQIADSYQPAKVLVGELWRPKEQAGRYFGNGQDSLQLGFDFNWAWEAAEVAAGDPSGFGSSGLTELWRYQARHFPAGYQTMTFLSNHDSYLPRPMTRHNGNANQVAMAAALQLLGPGTPMIYYGNELGLTGKVRPDVELRGLFNWQDEAKQTQQANSLLQQYRTYLQIRHQYPVTKSGQFTSLRAHQSDVFALARYNQNEAIVLVLNVAKTKRTISLDLSSLKHSALQKEGIYLSPLLGDQSHAQTILDGNYDRVRIENVPEQSVTALYLGQRQADLIAAYPGDIEAITTPVMLRGPKLDSLYLRGSMNGWDGSSPMTTDESGVWTVDTVLSAGQYEYKFEVRGESTWGLNWGDNEGDGQGDVDGHNIRLRISESGCYRFSFDANSRRYQVEASERCR
ncbi:alpha-amylase family glycosyl hydrolase [Corallincola platygyrae]|uniref:Alpha-amylase family glycosyl hydrolase n=1 Tax=Corallincola platygyrae TaxID=1193278 RepID=A0ABW4XQ67_9GAMM